MNGGEQGKNERESFNLTNIFSDCLGEFVMRDGSESKHKLSFQIKLSVLFDSIPYIVALIQEVCLPWSFTQFISN